MVGLPSASLLLRKLNSVSFAQQKENHLIFIAKVSSPLQYRILDLSRLFLKEKGFQVQKDYHDYVSRTF